MLRAGMSVAASLPVPALSSSSLTLSTGSVTLCHSDPASVPLPVRKSPQDRDGGARLRLPPPHDTCEAEEQQCSQG